MTDASKLSSHVETSADTALSVRAERDVARMRALLDRPLPAEELIANTELVAMRNDRRGGRTRSILVFRVGDEQLAIEAEDAHRVVRVSTIRRVPHRTNDVFAGIANIGGELTIVARIGAALGIVEGQQQTHFLVIGPVADRWAFAVDAVDGVRRIDESTLLSPPTTVRHAADGCAANLVHLVDDEGAERLVTVLDATKLAARFARSLA
jgi:chemotaxis-related protein WspD